MGQSLTRINIHLTFHIATDSPRIPNAIQAELNNYIAGILQNLGCFAIEINGVEDHIHILMCLAPTRCLADTVRDIKASSSKWLKGKLGKDSFKWQSGYGAFSVNASGVDNVRRYILGQAEHHKRWGYYDELKAICDKYGVSYDERYIQTD